MGTSPAALSTAIEARTIRKVRSRVVPFIMVLMVIASLDRMNIGFAALTMNKELAITSQQYGFLAGIFFLGDCYDMDFPRLIAQAGRQRVDILLSPASDWAGIDPRHTQMAQFRAIEQGFNLLRQANLGLSAAYDYEGAPWRQWTMVTLRI